MYNDGRVLRHPNGLAFSPEQSAAFVSSSGGDVAGGRGPYPAGAEGFGVALDDARDRRGAATPSRCTGTPGADAGVRRHAARLSWIQSALF